MFGALRVCDISIGVRLRTWEQSPIMWACFEQLKGLNWPAAMANKTCWPGCHSNWAFKENNWRMHGFASHKVPRNRAVTSSIVIERTTGGICPNAFHFYIQRLSAALGVWYYNAPTSDLSSHFITFLHLFSSLGQFRLCSVLNRLSSGFKNSTSSGLIVIMNK